MGVWGPGNFDSDTVADGLGALTGRIVDDITAEFEDDSSLEPDEWGGEMVPAWLEIDRHVELAVDVGETLFEFGHEHLRTLACLGERELAELDAGAGHQVLAPVRRTGGKAQLVEIDQPAAASSSLSDSSRWPRSRCRCGTLRRQPTRPNCMVSA